MNFLPAPLTRSRATVWLFAVTLFVSACLLFSLQPMVAKIVLPLLGGTPAVWNTCMLFFQAVLLIGYGYAALASRWRMRTSVRVHLGLLMLVGLLLRPITAHPAWLPPAEGNPIFWLLGLLTLAVGLPFFLLSTTAPLLQWWFAKLGGQRAPDPYFLYAASNGGSLLALLSYPTLIEPGLQLRDQSRLWMIGYGTLSILLVGCAWLVRRYATDTNRSPAPSNEPAPALPWSRRLRWVLLAFAPSSLLLGATTYLSTDLAAIPLLWVLPLALYLLTFVVTFARPAPQLQRWMIRAMPIVILPLIILMVTRSTEHLGILIFLHLATLFVSAMVCHGELAQDRPSAHHLTEFYLWVALGGVLGGVFNALVAPVIFETVMEYPVALMLVCLLRPGLGAERRSTSTHWLDYAWPLALGLLTVTLVLEADGSGFGTDARGILVRYGAPALLCALFRYRPVRFGLGVAVLLGVGLFMAEIHEPLVHLQRSFFGVYRVIRRDAYHRLVHGTTLHGMQSLNPARRRQPLTYYDPTGPLGQVFEAFTVGELPRLRHVAVIGLGTGSTACYASAGQQWTFYEIDPVVAQIATNPAYFTYLRDCLETVQIVFGDARLSLQRAPAHTYDLIVVDAFSSDAIPVHLLTLEALSLYLEKLSPTGVLAIHISNRYLNLQPILGNLAAERHLPCLARSDLKISKQASARGKTSSDWVVLAHQLRDVGPLATDPRWKRVTARPNLPVWSDEFSNLFGVLKWH